MRYRINVLVELIAYIDASFGIHFDGTSRTGMVMMIAGAVVAAWSVRQHLVTKSSTEAEIVALYTCVVGKGMDVGAGPRHGSYSCLSRQSRGDSLDDQWAQC